MGDFKKRGGFGGGKPSFGGPRRDFGPSTGFRAGGRPSFGGRSDFKRDDRGGDRAQMFTATCATCNKQCEVPFRPNGEKPVYCRDCFRTQNDAPSSFPKKDFSRDFSKRESTPSFSAKPQVADKRIDDLKRQLDLMSVKLDNLIALVSPVQIEDESKALAVKKAVVKAVKVPAKKKLVKAKK